MSTKTEQNPKGTWVLYGTADRDPNELVCQFFRNREELDYFQTDLPGHYEVMILVGVDYDSFTVEMLGSSEPARDEIA